ncbi:MAG: UDP-glucose/GDP-mannose dehydrogenase family protein [Gammaproteobacteria bacterium]|nr:UDP-glucose/GDP-mannose dehydrogenase family protein [Gammaproteobacteria bacterium]
MNVSIFGAGYVGLVTGACFAEMGNSVTCADNDAAKIESLKQGQVPIHEPGLDLLIASNLREGRLRFTTSFGEAVASSSTHFIAVGTPPNEDGSADLRHVLEVARDLGRLISGHSTVVDKSTVPVGTADAVRSVIRAELERRGVEVDFDVVSNPEFLKEGDAITDFMRPDRVIIGTDSERAAELMRRLYAPYTRSHERMLVMGVRDAEMTKYAANSMLATRISFMNEIANLCERLGVDVENVRKGIGSDGRIGYSFIYPGCGYGGSCFPKDVRALVHMARENGVEPMILAAIEARNEAQKQRLFERITARFGRDLSGFAFGLWGLAFKPGTDDMREAPSVVLLQQLIEAGARVRAYDPAALEVARRTVPGEWFESGQLTLTEHQYDALDGVAALALVTEWKPFRYPDFGVVKKRMKQPVIFDGRNLYDPAELRGLGFEYFGIGR